MSPGESELFDKMLISDPEFNAEYHLQKHLANLIIEKNLLSLREQVKTDLNKNTFDWKRISIISAIVLITGVAAYFGFKNFENETNTISETKVEDLKKVPAFQDSSVVHSILENHSSLNTKAPSDLPKTPAKLLGKKDEETTNESTVIVAPISKPSSKSETITEAFKSELKTTDTSSRCPIITFQTAINPSCKGKSDGSIIIAKNLVAGGAQPYKFSVGSGFKSLPAFYDLEQGNYMVSVMDQNGCISEQSVELGEKSCTENKDYSFNPDVENWKIPSFENGNGAITITDKTEKILFKSNLPKGQSLEWNGKALTGELLETGTYLYLTESEQGEIRQGYIVILR